MCYVQNVAQLNIHTTAAFEAALRKFMRLRGLSNKSEAVRLAVEEAAERAAARRPRKDFSALRRAGLRAPVNPAPRFASDDDLWD